MTEQDWAGVKYFKKEEFPNWEKMDPRAIWILDEVRDYVGRPIIIHAGYEESGHEPMSLHGIVPCTAIDGHIEGISLFEQYLIMERFPWIGIGLYPKGEWENPGFHVDLRRFFDSCAEIVKDAKKTPQMRGARWIRWKRVYYGLNEKNMWELGVLP